MNEKFQKTKILLISSLGEQYELKSYESLQIRTDLSSKLETFQLRANVFDESDMKKYGVGSKVQIYSCKEDEVFDDHLIFKGIVTENPKTLNAFMKSYEINGVNDLGRSQFLLVNEVYSETNVSEIVRDLLNKYGISYYSEGFIQDTAYNITITFKDTHLYTCWQRLAEALGFVFYIDHDNKFYFIEENSRTSNDIIQINDYHKGTAKFSYDSSQLVNSLTVYGGNGLTPDITQSIKGDGLNSTFLFNYKPRASSSGSIQVFINDVAIRVGVIGINETNIDCLVSYNDSNIKLVNADNTERILQTSETLKMIYRAEFPLLTKLKETPSIEQYGLYEDIVSFPDVTDKAALVDRGMQYLKKYAYPIVQGNLSTWKNLWDCGELVKVQIEVDEGSFVDEWLQISQKTINLSPNNIKVDLNFAKRTSLGDVLKTVLEKLADLEKQSQNEQVEQIDSFSDSFRLSDLASFRTHNRKRFKIGSSYIGDEING